MLCNQPITKTELFEISSAVFAKFCDASHRLMFTVLKLGFLSLCNSATLLAHKKSPNHVIGADVRNILPSWR